MKSTADSGVKETLKPCARKRSEPYESLVGGEGKGMDARTRSESGSEEGR